VCDSFIDNKDMVTWPTKAGWYWFYGYRYKRIGVSKNDKKRLLLCEASVNASGHIMVISPGAIFFNSEPEEPQFIPATLPTIKED
jgi:hypothetical protein